MKKKCELCHLKRTLSCAYPIDGFFHKTTDDVVAKVLLTKKNSGVNRNVWKYVCEGCLKSTLNLVGSEYHHHWKDKSYSHGYNSRRLEYGSGLQVAILLILVAGIFFIIGGAV